MSGPTPVVMEDTTVPMSMDHARALCMAVALSRLLGDLNDRSSNGAGSKIEAAWDKAEELVELLEPPPSDDEDAPPSVVENLLRWRPRTPRGRNGS